MAIKERFQETVRFDFNWEETLSEQFNNAKNSPSQLLQFLNAINSRYIDISTLSREKEAQELQNTVNTKMGQLTKQREQVIEALKEHCKANENRFLNKELSPVELQDLVNNIVFHYALEEPLFAHVSNVDQAIYNVKEGDIHHERLCEFVEERLKHFGITKTTHEIKEFVRHTKCIV